MVMGWLMTSGAVRPLRLQLTRVPVNLFIVHVELPDADITLISESDAICMVGFGIGGSTD
jgi:hypothetical protein